MRSFYMIFEEAVLRPFHIFMIKDIFFKFSCIWFSLTDVKNCVLLKSLHICFLEPSYLHYCFKGIGRKKNSETDCQHIQLLHKLVWKGFVKLPSPLIMCVQSGCTDRWSHWYVDEPWFWAYEVWSNIKDALNKKPLLYHPQDRYLMALLNSHHQSSMLCNVYFLQLLNAEISSILSFIHECVTTGSGYLTDLV